MPISLEAMKTVLLPGVQDAFAEPGSARHEDASRRRAAYQAQMAKLGAEEAARYAALDEEGRRAYDALTVGMMLRLRGVPRG
jgi:hypothetical protein